LCFQKKHQVIIRRSPQVICHQIDYLPGFIFFDPIVGNVCVWIIRRWAAQRPQKLPWSGTTNGISGGAVW